MSLARIIVLLPLRYSVTVMWHLLERTSILIWRFRVLLGKWKWGLLGVAGWRTPAQAQSPDRYHYNILYCTVDNNQALYSWVLLEGSLRAHFRVRLSLSLSLSHKRGDGRRKYFVTCRIEQGTAARNNSLRLDMRKENTSLFCKVFNLWNVVIVSILYDKRLNCSGK